MITVSSVSSAHMLEKYSTATMFYGRMVGSKELVLHMVPREGTYGDSTGKTGRVNRYVRDQLNMTAGHIQVLLDDLWARTVTPEDIVAVQAMAATVQGVRNLCEAMWGDSQHGDVLVEAIEQYWGALEVIGDTLQELADLQADTTEVAP